MGPLGMVYFHIRGEVVYKSPLAFYAKYHQDLVHYALRFDQIEDKMLEGV